MQISQEKCVACGNCTYVCPMGAIYIDPVAKRAKINRDECVECYACYNGLSKEHLPPKTVRVVRKAMRALLMRFEPDPDICPTDAIEPDELAWPRVVRRAFSDPRVPHESTGIAGRGTEEVKTNDVSNRVSPGEVGFTVEFGRPGVGARFFQIQEMSRALAAAGVRFEPKNPVTTLMTNTDTGDIREDILDEKVLSAILELKVPIERAEEIIRIVWEVEKRIDTIVVIGAGVRCDPDGEERTLAPVLEKLGYHPQRAKTNLGLGRPALQQPPVTAPQPETVY
jgi:ferredoxin